MRFVLWAENSVQISKQYPNRQNAGKFGLLRGVKVDPGFRLQPGKKNMISRFEKLGNLTEILWNYWIPPVLAVVYAPAVYYPTATRCASAECPGNPGRPEFWTKNVVISKTGLAPMPNGIIGVAVWQQTTRIDNRHQVNPIWSWPTRAVEHFLLPRKVYF